jgi:hypothetical protein
MALELMTFVLPFLFVLAIVYGALDLAAVFKKKEVNVIIAVVIAAFSVSNAAIVDSIIAAMPWAAMLFIILFFIKFVLSFFKTEKGKERDYTLIVIILALVAIFMASQGTQLIQDWLPGGFPVSEENLILIIGIVVIVAMLYAAYKKANE